MGDSSDERAPMRALGRLLHILECVAEAEGRSTPSTISRATGLSLSTVSRLLRQLAEVQALSRMEPGPTYALGPRIFSIASAGLGQHGLRRLARPVLESLRDHTGETSSLHVRSGLSRVCVDQVPSSHAIARILVVGQTYPLLGSATGEVLIAGAPASERRQTLSGADLSTQEQDELEARLEMIRALGYATSANRWAHGIASVAAPIVTGGTTIGALAVSGPVDRFTVERAEEVAPLLCEAGRSLSR